MDPNPRWLVGGPVCTPFAAPAFRHPVLTDHGLGQQRLTLQRPGPTIRRGVSIYARLVARAVWGCTTPLRDRGRASTRPYELGASRGISRLPSLSSARDPRGRQNWSFGLNAAPPLAGAYGFSSSG